MDETEQKPSRPWHRKTTVIATLSVAAIVTHLALRVGFRDADGDNDGALPQDMQQQVADDSPG